MLSRNCTNEHHLRNTAQVYDSFCLEGASRTTRTASELHMVVSRYDQSGQWCVGNCLSQRQIKEIFTQLKSSSLENPIHVHLGSTRDPSDELKHAMNLEACHVNRLR